MRNNTNNLRFPNHVTPETAAILAALRAAAATYNGLRPIAVANIVNSGEFGTRSDGATPISNRQATSDDVTNFSSIDYNNLNIPNPDTSVVNNNLDIPPPDAHSTPLLGIEEQHPPIE